MTPTDYIISALQAVGMPQDILTNLDDLMTSNEMWLEWKDVAMMDHDLADAFIKAFTQACTESGSSEYPAGFPAVGEEL